MHMADIERSEAQFKVRNGFEPAGDQPKAIKSLVDGIKKGLRHQTLLGVTGSGKTFTAANVIAQIGKPTLVIAHNKTLAAQLAQEYREFFPDNAVHYFVSYYDYYQPEAYMPHTDTYIEKEAQINAEIDRLRHASTQALLTRKDVIIVASVSCIYGLGSPEEYQKVHLKMGKGMKTDRAELIRKLITIYFERTNADMAPGKFRALGNSMEIMPVNERVIYRLEFGPVEGDAGVDGAHPHMGISKIIKIDEITRAIIGEIDSFFLFPAKHFVTPEDERVRAAKDIKEELDVRLKELLAEGKISEADRLKRRTNYDLALIKEVGYCNGIENYSRHFSGKMPGEAPDSLLSYFPHKVDAQGNLVPDFLTVIDESHVTIPQLNGMFAGDASRKQSLVDFGFRLPSAKDNRPLKFPEFLERVGQLVYTSATPGKYEVENSQSIAQQIIRPTGLIDPEVIVRPIISGASASKEERAAIQQEVDAKEAKKKAKKAPATSMWAQEGMRDSGYFPSADIPGHATDDIEVLPVGPEYRGQIYDFIEEAEKTITKGFRVIATTLTKKMAEDLSEFLKERKIKAAYLHSDIETLERIQILTELRKGTYDILIGVNLLREGLDLPEVALIGILDADKEGFLRSESALIQTIGRAARNVEGKVILYADRITGSMQRAIGETNRRRAIQIAYNTEHGITPKTIIKRIKDITEDIENEHQKTIKTLLTMDAEAYAKDPKKVIKIKEQEMQEAVKALDFETAAILRDEIRALLEGTAKDEKKKAKAKKDANKGIKGKREDLRG
jgi:excinuclease ABC subunit B